MNILILTRDEALGASLPLTLQAHLQARSTVVDSIDEAAMALRDYLFDCAIIDTPAPPAIRKLRAAKIKTPIIALEQWVVRNVPLIVECLGGGADDVLHRLFHPDELCACIEAVVRRTHDHTTSTIAIADIVLNLSEQTVSLGGRAIHMTPKEYQMLEIMALREGQIITKQMFLDFLYGGMLEEPEPKVLDVYICKLRRKFYKASGGRDYIENVWGRGYRLVRPEDFKGLNRTNTYRSGISYRAA
jgi:two-component system, cell cycle response regulator CtrA